MRIRRRFAPLLPVIFFIALRSLSHANPVPLPWTSGLFDSAGLDDILQTIRVTYTASSDFRHVVPATLAAPTGHVAVWKPQRVTGTVLATARSRAPPPALNPPC